MTRTLLVTLAVLASSCGLTSPGGGSGTLYVVARLTSDGSTPGSQARVTVRQTGAWSTRQTALNGSIGGANMHKWITILLTQAFPSLLGHWVNEEFFVHHAR